MPGDFDQNVRHVTHHRPWPLPARPWVMTQTWEHVLFAHWRIDPAMVAGLLPPSLPLDLFEGAAWIGVVPFTMSNVTARGLPALPWLSAFPELNVRTYVRLGGKAGVYFFSLDAARAAAVWAARAGANLPYRHATMRVRVTTDHVRYVSQRRGAPGVRFAARYRGLGTPRIAPVGTLEHFLAERYCLFVERRLGGLSRIDIHHPPWMLQQASGVVRAAPLTMSVGLPVSGPPECLHYARRQDTLAWLPVPARIGDRG
jgi:hypothetical protein